MSNETDEANSKVIAEGVKEGVTKGLAQAAGRASIKFKDKRILAIFVVVVLVGAYFLWTQGRTTHRVDTNQQHSQDATYALCVIVAKNSTSFDRLVNQLTTNIQNSKTLSPAEKQAALDSYDIVRQDIPDCAALARQKGN